MALVRDASTVVAWRGRPALTRLVMALTAMLLTLACAPAGGPTETSLATATPALSYIDIDHLPGRTALRCEECPLVEVTGVLSADTIQTAEGPVRLYGVFVAPEQEQCVEEAKSLLTQLAGGSVRVEKGPQEADSRGTTLRYLYTVDGDSIDEALVRGGTARASFLESQHWPWLLFQAEEARRDRAGCVWEQFRNMFPGRDAAAGGF